VYPEGEHSRIIRAARKVVEEGIAHPILMGRPERIRASAERLGVSLDGIHIEDPRDEVRQDRYAQELFRRRQRKGLTLGEARERVRDPIYHACMMVLEGDADGLIAGQ